MTFNESCIAIENYANDMTRIINDDLSDIYVIESQFNMGFAFESEGNSSGVNDVSLKQKFKDKLSSLWKKIQNMLKGIRGFFAKIFNAATGRNNLAYNKNLVSKQCNFIMKVAEKLKMETNSDIEKAKVDSTKESLFLPAIEVQIETPEGTLGADDHDIDDAKNNKSLDYAESVIKKFGVSANAHDISVSKGLKADLSIADASKYLHGAYKKVERRIIENYKKAVKDSTTKSGKELNSSMAKHFKILVKEMQLAALPAGFLRTSKLTPIKSKKNNK